MKTWRRHVTNALLLIAIQAFLCNAREFRIDCQRRFDGLSRATFLPGDIILFKKGQRFTGMFAPSGSGTDEAAITIATYGHGSRPRIDAGGKHIAGLLLRNVAYWEVNGLEISNTDGTDRDQGNLFGIYVLAEGLEGVYRHYVRSEPSEDEITPDAFSLVIEELASRQVLRTIGLPCKPKELRFIAGGRTVMTIVELAAREHRRNVALLYGVQPNELDGETISWTPCPE